MYMLKSVGGSMLPCGTQFVNWRCVDVLFLNVLCLNALKSSVTMFTPDTHQAKTHPKILIEDS